MEFEIRIELKKGVNGKAAESVAESVRRAKPANVTITTPLNVYRDGEKKTGIPKYINTMQLTKLMIVYGGHMIEFSEKRCIIEFKVESKKELEVFEFMEMISVMKGVHAGLIRRVHGG